MYVCAQKEIDHFTRVTGSKNFNAQTGKLASHGQKSLIFVLPYFPHTGHSAVKVALKKHWG